jgi:hypothetical protein
MSITQNILSTPPELKDLFFPAGWPDLRFRAYGSCDLLPKHRALHYSFEVGPYALPFLWGHWAWRGMFSPLFLLPLITNYAFPLEFPYWAAHKTKFSPLSRPTRPREPRSRLPRRDMPELSIAANVISAKSVQGLIDDWLAPMIVESMLRDLQRGTGD